MWTAYIQTSSTHVVVHNLVTFVKPNQIQRQYHQRTSWISKPFAQHVDHENNYLEYSYNQTVPSTKPKSPNDASMK